MKRWKGNSGSLGILLKPMRRPRENWSSWSLPGRKIQEKGKRALEI